MTAADERAKRARRRAARVEIDGRLVAVNARQHGTVATRSGHGCECEPCMAAARAHNTAYVAARRADPEFRRRAAEASRRYRARLRAADRGTTDPEGAR